MESKIEIVKSVETGGQELRPLVKVSTNWNMGSSRPVVHFLRQLVEKRVAVNGFESLLKQISVVDGGEGRCVCELLVTPEMSNPLKTLHGGMTATLVDAVSSWAVMTTGDNKPGVSVDLSVSYLQPAPVGERILIDARTLRLGRKLAFLTVDITRKETGKLVAQGKHTNYLQPVPVGEPILIDARRLGRKLAFLTGDITRKETGKLVAQGKHTKYMDIIVREYPPKSNT